MYLFYHPCIPWVSSLKGRESQIPAVLCEDHLIYEKSGRGERLVDPHQDTYFLLLQWFMDLSDLALLEYMSLMNIVMTQNQN